MALRRKNHPDEDIPEPRESIGDIKERFDLSLTKPKPHTADEGNWQMTFQDRLEDIAQRLNEQVMDSREKSLALTHLEEALMWINKAIFK